MTERREDIAELARKIAKIARNHETRCHDIPDVCSHGNKLFGGACSQCDEETKDSPPYANVGLTEQVAALLRRHVWEWLPVEERLPTLGQPVLVLTTPSRHCFVMQLDNDRSWIDPDSDVIGSDVRLHGYDVTHWAALPSAPLSLESSGDTK